MTVLGEHGDSYAAFLLERIARILEREEDHAAERYDEQPHVFTIERDVLPSDVFVFRAACRCEWSSGWLYSKTAAERAAEEHDREASA